MVEIGKEPIKGRAYLILECRQQPQIHDHLLQEQEPPQESGSETVENKAKYLSHRHISADVHYLSLEPVAEGTLRLACYGVDDVSGTCWALSYSYLVRCRIGSRTMFLLQIGAVTDNVDIR